MRRVIFLLMGLVALVARAQDFPQTDLSAIGNGDTEVLLEKATYHLDFSPEVAARYANRVMAVSTDSAVMAEAYILLGRAALLQGDYGTATAACLSASEIMGKEADVEVRYHILRAELNHKKGNWEEAKQDYETAIAVAKKTVGADHYKASLLLLQYYIDLRVADAAKARFKAISKDSMAVFEAGHRSKYHEVLARYQLKIANNPARAARHVKTLEQLAAASGKPNEHALVLELKGTLTQANGEMAAAEEAFQKAAGIYEQIGYYRHRANVLVQQAQLYALENKGRMAREVLDEVLGITRRNNWPDLQVEVYLLLSDIYKAEGRYREALEFKSQASGLQLRMTRETYAEREREVKKFAEQRVKESEAKANKEVNERIAADTALKSRERTLVILTAAFLFVLVLILALFYARTVRANKQLAKSQEEIKAINEDLNLAVAQKDAIYAELHHRVKNNLSILSGLLHLQELGTTDEHAKLLLQDSQNRIQSIALVHQRLYTDQDTTDVDLEDYLENLITQLKSTMAPKGKEIRYELDCDGIRLSLSQAVPIALIINELFTNSFKYAFKDGDSGLIGVRVEEGKQGEMVIEVYDNGPGIPEEAMKSPSTLGLRLINILSNQLGAIKTYSNTQYSLFRFEI